MWFKFKYNKISSLNQRINDYLKKHIEERNMLQKDAYKAFALRLRGLNTFRNQVVFIDFHKNAYYDYLISIQSKPFYKNKG